MSELERTHAETLEMLRAAQQERDALQVELTRTEEELAAALAGGPASFVRRWQVLGPIKELDRRARDEVERDPFRPDLRVAGLKGQVRWKPHESTADRISLDKVLRTSDPVECYLVSWVYSAAPQVARLSIGSDDGCCVWVNRRQIFERRESRSASPGQDKARAELEAGWNEVLAHVDNRGGGEWALFLEFQSEDGKRPLPLSQSSTPPRPAPADQRS
jgi:hypothetical protein